MSFPRMKQASPAHVDYLRQAGYPESVIRLLGESEPEDECEIGASRRYPILAMWGENEDCFPGYVIAPLGFLNVGSNEYGDPYCVDLGTRGPGGEPPVVLVPHDSVVEDESTEEEIRSCATHIADTYDEFVRKFESDQLPR